jgi:hypothetical protein
MDVPNGDYIARFHSAINFMPSSPSVSPSSQGRIKYNSGTQTFQYSANGSAYADFGGGSSLLAVTTITANSVFVTTTNDVVLCNASGITSPRQNIVLYTASGNTGRRVYIKKIDATPIVVEVDGLGAELIDGFNTFAITDQYQGITVVSDGTSWNILQ